MPAKEPVLSVPQAGEVPRERTPLLVSEPVTVRLKPPILYVEPAEMVMFWRGEIAVSCVTEALALFTEIGPLPNVVVATWLIVELAVPSSEIMAAPFQAVVPLAARLPRTRMVPLFKLDATEVELSARLPFMLRSPTKLKVTMSWPLVDEMLTSLKAMVGALNV